MEPKWLDSCQLVSDKAKTVKPRPQDTTHNYLCVFSKYTWILVSKINEPQSEIRHWTPSTLNKCDDNAISSVEWSVRKGGE